MEQRASLVAVTVQILGFVVSRQLTGIEAGCRVGKDTDRRMDDEDRRGAVAATRQAPDLD
jgi:hypothetical protein